MNTIYVMCDEEITQLHNFVSNTMYCELQYTEISLSNDFEGRSSLPNERACEVLLIEERSGQARCVKLAARGPHVAR